MKEGNRKWKLQRLEGLYRGYIGIIRYMLGLYRNNGKEHGKDHNNGLSKDYYKDDTFLHS